MYKVHFPVFYVIDNNQGVMQTLLFAIPNCFVKKELLLLKESLMSDKNREV